MKVLKFQSKTCVPCKKLSEIINTINSKYTIQEIDVDDDPMSAIKYNVRSVPSMYVVDEYGTVMKSMHGLKSKQEIVIFLS